jgi:hypothetical protein
MIFFSWDNLSCKAAIAATTWGKNTVCPNIPQLTSFFTGTSTNTISNTDS